MILSAHLEQARRELASQSAARLEAEILMAHALGTARSFLYANPDLELPQHRSESFHSLVKRRARGEPIAYLTGLREFWSLSLRVTPEVLIPRPETELLVETALQCIPRDARLRVADLGTGSGAIALALATERPACRVHATELSPGALAVARENARALGQRAVRFHLGGWCEPLAGWFHVILSNPPYVREDDPHLAQGDCRFEPRTALTPGKDALAAIRAIASQARERLAAGGWLLLEHGSQQAAEVRDILELNGFAAVETRRDLAGLERVTLGRWQDKSNPPHAGPNGRPVGC